MLWRLPLLVLLAHLAAGCQATRFYTQAAAGQWEILTKRRPIERMLADDTADPELKRQLRLVRELCAFAEEHLALPSRRQYTRYADLGRPFVVWNIHAAPEFSFEAKTWWYPLVGRLEYQGYFKKELAIDYANRLRASGLDVFVGGVDAYSTLGWFNDPVLNTFVHLPEAELADLIFHELAHRRLFFAGDTDFNEAFATMVAREGVRRWYESRSDDAGLARYLEHRRGEDAVISLILAAQQRLESLYSDVARSDVEILRAGKQQVIAELRTKYGGLREAVPGFSDYDDWMAAPINNAQLNTVSAYHELVPAFQRQLVAADNDLAEFYRRMEKLGKLDKEERIQKLSN